MCWQSLFLPADRHLVQWTALRLGQWIRTVVRYQDHCLMSCCSNCCWNRPEWGSRVASFSRDQKWSAANYCTARPVVGDAVVHYWLKPETLLAAGAERQQVGSKSWSGSRDRYKRCVRVHRFELPDFQAVVPPNPPSDTEVPVLVPEWTAVVLWSPVHWQAVDDCSSCWTHETQI